MTKFKAHKALLMALNVLFQKKSPILYINTYLSDVEIIQKIIVLKTEVKLASITSGFLNNGDYDKVIAAMREIYDAPMYIIDNSCKSIEQIKRIISELTKENENLNIFIDYDRKEKEIIDKIKNISTIPVKAVLNTTHSPLDELQNG